MCIQWNLTIKTTYGTTVVAKSFRTPRVCPLNPIVNKSCKIECCGNKMQQIVQNMILTCGIELKLSLFQRTIISSQHPLS